MQLVVPGRCCGPDASGNGGWVAGAVAGFLDVRPATVSLRRPPPLEEPLDVAVADGRVVVTEADGQLVAEAEPGRFEDDPPPFVPADVAAEAAAAYPGLEHHPFDRCLTCGTSRDVGDGLRIFTGPVPGRPQLVAAPFHGGALPDAVDGVLPEPMAWAAVDCPSCWPALCDGAPPMVLARLTAEVVAPGGVPAADLVSVGVQRWQDGRKHGGAAALYTPGGELVARSEALWVELR